MVVLTLGRREKKTATKEQNSLAASLRTCSSFSWSEYSLSIATAAAAHAQTGTQHPYDREIKCSTGKSTQGGTGHSLSFRTHFLFVLGNYLAHRTFQMRKLSVMNGCQRPSDMLDLSNRACRSYIRPAFTTMDRGF